MSAVLASAARPGDERFQANAAAHRALLAELREQLARARAGGGPPAAERPVARGKLLARERVDRLVDPGTAFLELNALAALDVYDNDAPGAGIVTGVGVVEGRE